MTQTHTCEACGLTAAMPQGTFCDDVRCPDDLMPMRVLDNPDWCECGRGAASEPYAKKPDGSFVRVCFTCFQFWVDLGYLYPGMEES